VVFPETGTPENRLAFETTLLSLCGVEKFSENWTNAETIITLTQAAARNTNGPTLEVENHVRSNREDITHPTKISDSSIPQRIANGIVSGWRTLVTPASMFKNTSSYNIVK
jgi:hypothetical protein